MNDISETLRQLQQSAADPAPVGAADCFIQPVQLRRRYRGRRLLQWSALLSFALGFVVHQWSYPFPVADVAVAEKSTTPAQPMPASESALLARSVTADPALLAGQLNSARAPATGAAPEHAETLQSALPAVVNVGSPVAAGNDAQQNGRQLSLLQKRAELALQRDRLTTPVGDNAVAYYRAMLVLAPDNIDALAGLARVAGRYQMLAESLQRAGNTAEANAMLTKAQALVPGNRIDFYAEAPAAELPVPVNAPVLQAADSVQPAPASASVAASAQSLAGQQLERARLLLARGDVAGAISQLQEGLARSASEQQVELLHQAYLANGQAEQAAQLRRQYTPLLADFRRARMQANEWIKTGDYPRAIAVLEQYLPEYDTDSEYYGLLAGLYYRANRYSDASQAYSRLLSLDGNNGNYWLGYAVALDAQAEPRALQAFQRARQLLPEQDGAQEYIHSRIQTLTPAAGATP